MDLDGERMKKTLEVLVDLMKLTCVNSDSFKTCHRWVPRRTLHDQFLCVFFCAAFVPEFGERRPR